MTVDVAASDYSELMQGLPWEFKRNSSSITAEEGDASAEIRWEFVSAKPVRMSAGGSLYLRADLTVSEFGKAGVAESRWQALLEKAHPDMGLSYAWDYLIFRGQVIYRLHADCTFSDSGFDSMIANLKAMLPQEDIEKAQTIRCSCGGGCRGGPVIEAIKGGEMPQ